VDEINQGQVDLAEWTMRHIPLYSHTVATLQKTTVHETLQKKLNTYKQQVQQVGAVIDNGMRHLNKERERNAQVGQPGSGDPDSPQQPQEPTIGGIDQNGDPLPPDQSQQNQQDSPQVDPMQDHKLAAAQQNQSHKISAAGQDQDMKMNRLFAEAHAKVQVMQQMSAASIAIKRQESMAKIASMDAQTAAAMRRQDSIARMSE